MKARAMVAVFAAVVGLLGGRKLLRAYEEQQSRERELLITHRVDLAEVADSEPASAPVMAPAPQRTAPLLVELTFLQPGAKPRPFRGHYQVLDNNGIVFSEGDAPADGGSVMLVLSPSDYEVRAGRSFKQVLPLRHTSGERQALRLVVPR